MVADSGITVVRQRFSGISACEIQTERDRVALSALKKVPLLPKFVEKFNELAIDHLLYVENSADTVCCGEQQFPTLYNMVKEGARILDVPIPELYVRSSPEYNAVTAGVKRTYIVLNSNLINGFSDAELRFIVGHELGHIKCKHLLYHTVGMQMMPLVELISQATLGIGKLVAAGLGVSFMEWMRQSEFSCDRAGLLVCQDPEAALSATMKLAKGFTRLDHETSLKAFLEQASNHEQMGVAGKLAKVFLFMTSRWNHSHPEAVHRVKALHDWSQSEDYLRILEGNYKTEATTPS